MVFGAFMAKSTAVFATRPEHPTTILKVVNLAYANNLLGQRIGHLRDGSKLLVDMNLNCKDQKWHATMNQFVQQGLMMTLSVMQKLTAEASKQQAKR